MTAPGVGPSGQGPLAGIRVVEIASLGPVPFVGMLMSDLGARVVRVDRPAGTTRGNWRDGLADARTDVMGRGKRSLCLDLKDERGRDVLLRLLETADVLTEGMRPGAMERLGLGPDDLRPRFPRLVYARVSGWGRRGVLAETAGHDINYLALSGVLGAIGDPDRPPEVPLNLVADFGGGGALAAFGVCAALLERQTSGQGQVVDHSMLGGTVVLSAMLHGMLAAGRWSPQRHANDLDGGAPYYRTYATADGRYLAVGAIEPQFYRAFLDGLGLSHEDWPQHDRSRWPRLHRICTETFARRTCEEWETVFDGTDACVTPVLDLVEAQSHPGLRDAAAYVDHAGLPQPGVFPEFSRSPGALSTPAPAPGADTTSILSELGLGGEAEELLRAAGVVS